MVKSTILLLSAFLFGFNLSAQTIISFGASWQYSDDGQPADPAWPAPSFTAGNWKEGPAPLGYGIKNPGTEISYGADPQNKHITTYFRKTFTLSDAQAFAFYQAKLKRDDGAVVYVNGKEVYRSNLPQGPIHYQTLAASASDEGTTAQLFSIPASAFTEGVNVLAVEVHQSSRKSSDLAFDLELSGSAGQGGDLVAPFVRSIRRQNPDMKATSQNSVTFRVAFSEPVRGVRVSDFVVEDEAGDVHGSLAENAVRPLENNIEFDVTVSNIRGSGELRLDLQAANTRIRDEAGNILRENFQNGQSYTIRTGGEAPVLTRGPYLQMGSQNAVTIRWRTQKATDSKVEVGTSPGHYPLTFRNASRSTEHEVRVTGLKPGTRYYYRIGNASFVLKGGESYYFSTAPKAGKAGKVRIAVLGDCGRNSYGVQTRTLNSYLNHVGNTPAELLLLLGDNAYPDGTDAEYQAHFFNAYDSTILKNHVLFPAPGNHDYHTTTQASREAPYYKVFSMPTRGESGGVPSGTEAYYSFDWGDIHFISLDSYGTESPDNSRLYDTLGAQVSWIKKDLAANTKPWVIVYWHHPPYSMGSHNSDTEDQMALIRQNFVRILERNGVDLVLTGHSHNYERSYLLRGHYEAEATFSARRHAVSTSSGRYNGTSKSCPYLTVNGKVNHGTVYVVSGSAGGVGEVQESWPHKALPFADNEGGMLYLEVEQNRLDARYLRSDGKIKDQFTIMKDVQRPNPVIIEASGPVQLQASWLGTYKWSTGETTRSITVYPDRNTQYQVWDSQNCLSNTFLVKPAASAARRMETAAQPQASPVVMPQVIPNWIQRGAPILIQAPEKQVLEVSIMDMNGRQVYRGRLEGTSSLESSSFTAGMYLIRLVGADFVSSQKFVIGE